ncbi:MAG: hypothetical protein EOP85_19990 [Verrucomicrobiaceae bacterium]|nr:MAG: hypothetical protein EOP85_19990 [Verrucomicrobiaceae bacterium]
MIQGTYKVGMKRVACRNAYCDTCARPRFTECFRSWLILHVFFIPLLPIGFIRRWFCSVCRHQVDGGQSIRPYILRAGLVACRIMVAAGVIMWVNGAGRDFSVGFIFIWGVLAVTFATLRKKQVYRDYIASVVKVEPLRTDQCPYCHSPLFAKATPRCERCKVDLM